MRKRLPELPLEPPEYETPRCPICGRECDTVYKIMDSEDIVGCDNCIFKKDSWDEPQCFPNRRE